MPTQSDRAPIACLDPGWLFLLAGIALLAATIVIPAADDLDEVRLQRDRALALEQHKAARLQSYQDYLGAVQREEPALVMALAASQLNQIPAGWSPIGDDAASAFDGSGEVSVFTALEPAPPSLPERQRSGSILERWTSSDTIRPWLIVAGSVLVFTGLLPQARQAGTRESPEPIPG